MKTMQSMDWSVLCSLVQDEIARKQRDRAASMFTMESLVDLAKKCSLREVEAKKGVCVP